MSARRGLKARLDAAAHWIARHGIDADRCEWPPQTTLTLHRPTREEDNTVTSDKNRRGSRRAANDEDADRTQGRAKRQRRDEGPAATGEHIKARNARRFWNTQEREGRKRGGRSEDRD